MDNTPYEPMMVWQFLRRHFVRIVIGAVLAVAVSGLLSVWMPYQRDQRIAREIEAHGGQVVFRYAGPDWIPNSVRDRVTLFSRVRQVDLCFHPPEKFFSEMGSLTNLIDLNLNNTQVTDADLEHLKGLTNLVVLRLNNTHVTGRGLEQLKGLTNLKGLVLDNTQVTDAGLEHLKELRIREKIT